MRIFQKSIVLKPYPRGFHLITDEVLGQLPEIKSIKVGILHIFIQHTSAAISINENADVTVRNDFETFTNDMVSEDYPHFIHTYEGPDDMPAHIKSSLYGNQLNLPISAGKLNLGTWQGIYLCEFRNQEGARKLVISIMGE